MNLKLTIRIIGILLANCLKADINPLIINDNIKMPKDSILSANIVHSLNCFLAQKENQNSENSYVLREDLLETSILLDEFKEIEKSSKSNDSNYFQGYLINIIRLDSINYLIQLDYKSSYENNPNLRSCFELIAKFKSDKVYFASPLSRNCVNWKTMSIGNINFHYKATLNVGMAKKYVKNINFFDQKLQAHTNRTEFYCCENFQEALKNIGVIYKSDYNGINYNSLSSNENNTHLQVSGTLTPSFSKVDPHDLWHERLHNVISTKVINKPVDEGCAYLYGGSWGLSWNQILIKFKEFVLLNPNADWLNLYNESKNFDEKAKCPLNVDYFINALIVQKIEKEKGFTRVKELLSCGKKTKDNDNYLEILDKLTGINKANFNERISILIKNS